MPGDAATIDFLSTKVSWEALKTSISADVFGEETAPLE